MTKRINSSKEEINDWVTEDRVKQMMNDFGYLGELLKEKQPEEYKINNENFIPALQAFLREVEE